MTGERGVHLVVATWFFALSITRRTSHRRIFPPGEQQQRHLRHNHNHAQSFFHFVQLLTCRNLVQQLTLPTSLMTSWKTTCSTSVNHGFSTSPEPTNYNCDVHLVFWPKSCSERLKSLLKKVTKHKKAQKKMTKSFIWDTANLCDGIHSQKSWLAI